MKPIRLLWLVAIFALGWSAWWGWGAWQAKSGLRSWLEERRAAGWQAEWDEIELRGYPTRLDRTITNLTLANTEAGWVWNAPFVQILGLNYQKNHVILVWPNEMTLQTTGQSIAITGEELRGSLTFLPGPERRLDSATLVFRGLAFASDAGWTSSSEEIRLATRPTPDSPGTRDIALEVFGLTPRSPALAKLAEAGLLPGEVETLKADLGVAFDHPWDKRALEQDRPQPRAIDLRELAVKWGRLELRVAGDLEVARDGSVSGEVQVKATNWREMLELARRTGALPDAITGTIESALTLVSGLAGRSDTLDIPLTFSGGRTRIGPVPVGPAPLIRLP